MRTPRIHKEIKLCLHTSILSWWEAYLRINVFGASKNYFRDLWCRGMLSKKFNFHTDNCTWGFETFRTASEFIALCCPLLLMSWQWLKEKKTAQPWLPSASTSPHCHRNSSEMCSKGSFSDVVKYAAVFKFKTVKEITKAKLF